MSVFFNSDATPSCKYCRHLLPGRSHSGHCPHCGHWYETRNASVAPGRIRALALLVHSRPASVLRVPWVLQSLGTILIIVGNATLVVVVGRMALKALYRACGMTW